LTMSDRVAVFSDGRIQQAATPTELYENAANAFVANFVGENNGLTGRVLASDGEWATLQLADGTTVSGRAGAELRTGGDAMLALRPERAHIATNGDAAADAARGTGDSNVVHALVQELVYCGDHHRVHLKLAHGESVVVKVPNTQHRDLPALGHNVSVTWRRDDCKVLPALAPRAAVPTSDHTVFSPSSSASPLIAGVN
jgi:putative spermidine/putrescine transport system ATP-binding protein